MKIILVILTLVIGFAIVHAKSSRTVISLEQDEDGTIEPNFFVPLYFGENNHFFSGVGYGATAFKETGIVNGFTDSKRAKVSKQEEFRLSAINYQNKLKSITYSFGLEALFHKIDNTEFGYIHDSNNDFNQGNDYYIAFDNEVSLDIVQYGARADVTIPLGKYFISRVGATIFPLSRVSVQQETLFKPLVSEKGRSDSTTYQDLSFYGSIEIQTRLNWYVEFAYIGSYRVLPTKYDLAQLEFDGNGYVFTNNEIDRTETLQTTTFKILFDYKILGSLRPSLGRTTENISVVNNVNNEKSSVKNERFVIGFENRF